jgi:hypothetical protein
VGWLLGALCAEVGGWGWPLSDLWAVSHDRDGWFCACVCVRARACARARVREAHWSGVRYRGVVGSRTCVGGGVEGWTGGRGEGWGRGVWSGSAAEGYDGGFEFEF